MRVLLASASLFLVLTPALPAQGTPTAKADSLQWGPAPAVFPAGAKMAVVSGDPSKPGPFVIQLAMPDGYRLAPHFHPTAETVEVKQGTFLFAMGDTFDLAKTKPMNVGEKGSIPANMHHYATAKGATVVAVTSTGPFALTYVNPADNPQKPAAKP
jgi:quercetin dioxygenase-like cupin family protein